MRTPKSCQLGRWVVGGLAFLALLGTTCTEEKIVEIVVAFPTTLELIAEGVVNQHDDAGVVDLKTNLDLTGRLAEAGVDVTRLDPGAVKVSRLFYRITQADPEASRAIESGALTVERLVGETDAPRETGILVSGWSAPAGAVTDWIDITRTLGSSGVAMLNGFAQECVAALQGGPAVADPRFRFTVTGTSMPENVPTHFRYEIMIQFQAVAGMPFSVPF